MTGIFGEPTTVQARLRSRLSHKPATPIKRDSDRVCPMFVPKSENKNQKKTNKHVIFFTFAHTL